MSIRKGTVSGMGNVEEREGNVAWSWMPGLEGAEGV